MLIKEIEKYNKRNKYLNIIEYKMEHEIKPNNNRSIIMEPTPESDIKWKTDSKKYKNNGKHRAKQRRDKALGQMDMFYSDESNGNSEITGNTEK